MKGVQCYELFGGIALKNHTFSFHRHEIVIDIGMISIGITEKQIYLFAWCIIISFVCITHSSIRYICAIFFMKFTSQQFFSILPYVRLD